MKLELRAMTNSQAVQLSAVMILDDAVGEIFMFRVARQVLKR